MKLIRPNSNMHKFARVVLSTICLLISGFPTGVFAESASVQSNTYNVNHQLLHTETKSYDLLSTDFTTLVGSDFSLDDAVQVKPYETINFDSHPNYSKVSDFVYLDRDQFDLSLFSPDDSLSYTTDDAAVNAYIQTHPELAGVTDRRILLPVFEFDSDNDIKTYRDR